MRPKLDECHQVGLGRLRQRENFSLAARPGQHLARGAGDGIEEDDARIARREQEAAAVGKPHDRAFPDLCGRFVNLRNFTAELVQENCWDIARFCRFRPRNGRPATTPEE